MSLSWVLDSVRMTIDAFATFDDRISFYEDAQLGRFTVQLGIRSEDAHYLAIQVACPGEATAEVSVGRMDSATTFPTTWTTVYEGLLDRWKIHQQLGQALADLYGRWIRHQIG